MCIIVYIVYVRTYNYGCYYRLKNNTEPEMLRAPIFEAQNCIVEILVKSHNRGMVYSFILQLGNELV